MTPAPVLLAPVPLELLPPEPDITPAPVLPAPVPVLVDDPPPSQSLRSTVTVLTTGVTLGPPSKERYQSAPAWEALISRVWRVSQVPAGTMPERATARSST